MQGQHSDNYDILIEIAIEKGVDLNDLNTRRRIEGFARYLDIIDDERSWRYEGGYTNATGKVILRCLKCGTVKEFSCNTLAKLGKDSRRGKVHNHLRCDHCKHEEIEQRELEKREIKADKQMCRSMRVPMHRRCKVCGEIFEGLAIDPCCSLRCKTIYELTRERPMRTIPKKAQTKDTKYIDIGKLYKRDKGVCYLCGGICDLTADQYEDTAPTIEHVVPIAKGGKDEWSNVRLAHFRCNLMKSDHTDWDIIREKVGKGFPLSRNGDAWRKTDCPR